MTREQAHLHLNVITLEPVFLQQSKLCKLINVIFDDHDAQLKECDKENKKLKVEVLKYKKKART